MLDGEKQYAVAISIAWLLLVVVALTFFQSISLEMLFVLWINGLLGLILLIEPHDRRNVRIRYLKIIGAGGTIIFLVIIARKFLLLFNT